MESVAGWERVLHELAGQRRGRLLGFASMLAGPDDAEDLVQEAIVATFSRGRGFEDVASAEAYVRRAIATRYVDRVRSQSADRRRAERVAPAEAVPDASERVATVVTLHEALKELAPRPRACVTLRYLSEMSVREVAHELGLSEGAVKRYTSDGIRALNALLGTDEPEDVGETAAVVPMRGGVR
ncbi:sigma-70 family RNA polymerase sigma factor [Demequina sp. NBRC 110054]|uniref:sigma-70 family RNA polymerase sigma factor n=1 Tax=Demequina sp. NBRC 110054 TaxID=1570343 RepID=UPI000A031448|nr:sigma-70 family RNA polymerase sigma factor [Demequina sp. NBRC 110054]